MACQQACTDPLDRAPSAVGIQEAGEAKIGTTEQLPAARAREPAGKSGMASSTDALIPPQPAPEKAADAPAMIGQPGQAAAAALAHSTDGGTPSNAETREVASLAEGSRQTPERDSPANRWRSARQNSQVAQ